MPYARNADLPANVRNPLPDAAQTLFRRVVNAALARGDSEESAFRQAWATVSEHYEKPENGGKWVAKKVRKRKFATLYIRRNVENAEEIIAHFREQGIAKTQVPEDMHVTVAYSKAEVEWPDPDNDRLIISSPEGRAVMSLDDGKAVVLKFVNKTLQRRWKELCEHGCSWDYESYIPHITITWEAGDLDISKVQPWTGPIELGPEIFEELNENWEANHVEKQCNTIVVSLDQKAFYTADQVQEIIKRLSEATANGATVISVSPKVEKREPEKLKFNFIKVNKKLGLIFGWAIVSKIGGEEYFDLQGDHIPEDAMLEAATEFMEKKRTLKLMHKGEPKGDVVFAWPLTEEVAKAMGIQTQVTGLMIAVKPTSKKLIEAAENGELQGFSIGGLRLVDEEVE